MLNSTWQNTDQKRIPLLAWAEERGRNPIPIARMQTPHIRAEFR